MIPSRNQEKKNSKFIEKANTIIIMSLNPVSVGRIYSTLFSAFLILLMIDSTNGVWSHRSLQNDSSPSPITVSTAIPTFISSDDATSGPATMENAICYICGNETFRVVADLNETIGQALCSSAELYGINKRYTTSACTDFQTRVQAGACTCNATKSSPPSPTATIQQNTTATSAPVGAPVSAPTTKSIAASTKNCAIRCTVAVASIWFLLILI